MNSESIEFSSYIESCQLSYNIIVSLYVGVSVYMLCESPHWLVKALV